MSDEEYASYDAEYCENCGQLFDASETIEQTVEEPVHRVDLLEAIGPVDEVGETVALERRQCECTGQIVKRFYAHPIGYVPDTGYLPDDEQLSGRDADKDALFDRGDGFEEVREIPGIESDY